MERHEQYKDTLVVIEFPNWGSNALIDYLKAMTFCQSVEELPWVTEYKTRAGKTRTKPNYRKQTRRLQFTFNQYQTSGGHLARFKRDLENVFRPGFLTITESTRNHFKDNWELLDYELSTVDWSGDMSDDHRAWCALQRSQREIKALVEELETVDSVRLSALLRSYYQNNDWAGWVRQLDPIAPNAEHVLLNMAAASL